MKPKIIFKECNIKDFSDNIKLLNGNAIIEFDNLPVICELESQYNAKIKCIYLDPPYNTRRSLFSYNDNTKKIKWINNLRIRIKKLYNLLREDGSLWISINDIQSHSLRCICDNIFGENNYVSTIIWQKKSHPSNNNDYISSVHENILVYAKNKDKWKPNLIQRSEGQLNYYKNFDNDPRGKWRSSDLSTCCINRQGTYSVIGPTGIVFNPPNNRFWSISKKKFLTLDSEKRIWWGKNKDKRPMLKKFFTDVRDGITPTSLWLRDEVGDAAEAKQESKEIFGSNSFSTPKPERLLGRIIELSTNKGDLFLDPYLGSGTSIAVAQKMQRKWIGIEKEKHCYTHCKYRLENTLKNNSNNMNITYYRITN